MNADDNLIVVNLIQNKTVIMISVDVDCSNGEYTKDCTGTKSFVDDLVVTYDEIVDMQETTSINPDNQTNYRFIAVGLLGIECLILLVVIVVKYYENSELTIMCLLPY